MLCLVILVTQGIPDLEQTGFKCSLGTRKKYLVLSQALYSRTDSVSLKGREKALTSTLPFWEADPFCPGTKTGKNIHIAAIRTAQLACDEQTYLPFDFCFFFFGYMIRHFDLQWPF